MNQSVFKGSFSIFCLCLIIAFIPFNFISGQTAREEAQKLERPKDCGVSRYDDFKNSSFNLLADILKTDLNYEKLKIDIGGYLSGGKDTTVSGVNTDVNKLKAILKAVKAMDDRVKKLVADGNELLQNAADIKPVTAANQASSNPKTSMKAVELSDKLMHEITNTVSRDIEVLVKKITDLGGTVEEEVKEIEEPK